MENTSWALVSHQFWHSISGFDSWDVGEEHSITASPRLRHRDLIEKQISVNTPSQGETNGFSTPAPLTTSPQAAEGQTTGEASLEHHIKQLQIEPLIS